MPDIAEQFITAVGVFPQEAKNVVSDLRLKYQGHLAPEQGCGEGPFREGFLHSMQDWMVDGRRRHEYGL